MMFPGLRKLGNICCGHKMFLNKIRNIFCVWDTKFVSALKTDYGWNAIFKGPGKRGHIVADTYVSLFVRARNICCGHKFCVRDTKNVFDFVQKHFGPATNVSQIAQQGNRTFILCSARLRAQETSWATIALKNHWTRPLLLFILCSRSVRLN